MKPGNLRARKGPNPAGDIERWGGIKYERPLLRAFFSYPNTRKENNYHGKKTFHL